MNEKFKEIVEKVLSNYDNLPKSKFDDEECIIIYVKKDSNGGYGHHYFEGLGITKEGKIIWYFSSGCSCSGGPWSKDATFKAFEVNDTPYDDIIENFNIKEIESFKFKSY